MTRNKPQKARGSAKANATQQLVRAETTTETDTETEQIVTVRQSTEIVQTLLHGSISALCFLRELFDPTCFIDQFYRTINNHYTYDEYAAGIPENSDERKGYGFKSLMRNKSKRADQFLDWLEIGAFDALRKGYLHALHVSLSESPEEHSNILEVYTFSFRYKKGNPEENAGTLSSLDMTGPTGEKVNLKKARAAMSAIIRNIVSACGTMPHLPDDRYLMMHIVFTADCPRDYHPPGFVASGDHIIRFPNTDCEKITTPCGNADLGFHAVALKTTYLTLNDPPDDGTGTPRLPGRFTYGNIASRFDDIETPPVAGESGYRLSQMRDSASGSQRMQDVVSSTEANTRAQRSQSTPRRAEEEQQMYQPSPLTVHPAEMDLDLPVGLSRNVTSNGRRDATASPRMDTQGSNSTSSRSLSFGDIAARDKLHGMLQSSVQQNDTQFTQQLGKTIYESGNPYALMLSQKTIQELDLRRSNLLPPRRTNASATMRSASIGPNGDTDKVVCQCGWNGDEGDMINCDWCDTWHHTYCYGYKGREDQRIPDTHACYQCMLKDKDAAVLREMESLALHRRGVHLLQEKTFESLKQFAAELHCDVQDASKLVQHLRKVKLVATGKRIALEKSEEVSRRLVDEYFDPTLKIGHKFELPPSPNTTFQPTMMMTQATRATSQGKNPQIDSHSRQSSRLYGSNVMPNARESGSLTGPMAFRDKRKRTRESEATSTSSPKRLRFGAAAGYLDVGEGKTTPTWTSGRP